jgi:ABC-type phosphate/phosphonate transport system permease subunit
MRDRSLILIRRTHLYLSVFFSPLLLMFILTGWWQTVTSDDEKERNGGFFHDLIKKFSTVHTDSYFPHPGAAHQSHALVKILVVSMCLALIISIVLGLCLAWQTIKSKWPVVLAFGLGILVPAILLFLI